MKDNRFYIAFHSVRTRLVLLNVGVLALTLFVLGYAVRYTIRVDLLNSLDNGLTSFADRIQAGYPLDYALIQQTETGHVSLPPGSFDPRFLPPPPKDNPFGRLTPRISDMTGRTLIPYSEKAYWDAKAYERSTLGETIHESIVIDGSRIRILSVPMLRAGKVVAVLQVAQSLKNTDDQIARVTRTLLTLIPIALACAALGGLFLTQRALLPVRSITKAAASIEAQNLSGRLDVTGKDEFAELASTFNAMLSRLEATFEDMEKAYERQRRFTADASHELRTPLSVIKANSSLALSSKGSVERYRAALLEIDNAADRSNTLIRDLLTIARAGENQLELERTNLSLLKVLNSAVAIVNNSAVKITINIPKADIVIFADQDSITRVFVNLLQNSIRHTPITGSIIVSATKAATNAKVVVEDTGEGIPAKHLPFVFERFYRVDAARSRSAGGTGLGLSICKAIAEAHDGSIDVESVVGRGTSVIVTIPIAEFAAPSLQEDSNILEPTRELVQSSVR